MYGTESPVFSSMSNRWQEDGRLKSQTTAVKPMMRELNSRNYIRNFRMYDVLDSATVFHHSIIRTHKHYAKIA
jgi:hypothetical protein